MPSLEKISLVQFKNYGQASFGFAERITGICGLNGTGKTNLLDAIYYLCFTKSYFASTDAQLVKKNCAGFRVSGDFLHQNTQHRVAAILRENGKKEISWDGEPYQRVSQHIGRLPAVVIAPDDIDIITGGGEGRRKLIDAMICQIDGEYLQQLIAYNKVLLQRNSLLKQMADNTAHPAVLMDVLDDQLAARGSYIFEKRMEVLTPFLEKATEHYQKIAGREDFIMLSYQSHLDIAQRGEPSTAVFKTLLRQNLARDKALQRTTTGIHRDDLLFEMMAQPFKQTASQGQRKSLLFALKLTEFEWLEKYKGFPPILLLDDVFEKLDDQRMHNLLTEVCLEKKGQVFITDTHESRLHENLNKLNVPHSLIRL